MLSNTHVLYELLLLCCRFYDDIEYMLRVRPCWYWKVTWRFVSPLIVLVIFVCSLLNMGMKPVTYSAWREKKVCMNYIIKLSRKQAITKRNCPTAYSHSVGLELAYNGGSQLGTSDVAPASIRCSFQ